MSLLSMQAVNKIYTMKENTLHVLKDIDFIMEEGEFVALLGPSGSGKSTMMNIIGCMDNVSDGSFYFRDTAVHTCTDSKLAHLRNEQIGFIFQKYHLISQYTILQNVMMPLLIRGMSKQEAKQQAIRCLEDVGLQDRLHHKPSELSGGQQQRASIARALITRPALLLADEPTGALDSKTGEDILHLFLQLHAQGHSIVMITHDEAIARKSKRIVRINDGVLSLT